MDEVGRRQALHPSTGELLPGDPPQIGTDPLDQSCPRARVPPRHGVEEFRDLTDLLVQLARCISRCPSADAPQLAPRHELRRLPGYDDARGASAERENQRPDHALEPSR